MRKVVFISGPYSASTQLGIEANINQARKAAVWCAEHEIFYFCPHLNSVHFELFAVDIPTHFYYAMDEEILSRCDAIVMVGKWWNSKGAKEEIQFAGMNKKRIFYFETEQKELLNYCRENK